MQRFVWLADSVKFYWFPFEFHINVARDNIKLGLQLLLMHNSCPKSQVIPLSIYSCEKCRRRDITSQLRLYFSLVEQSSLLRCQPSPFLSYCKIRYEYYICRIMPVALKLGQGRSFSAGQAIRLHQMPISTISSYITVRNGTRFFETRLEFHVLRSLFPSLLLISEIVQLDWRYGAAFRCFIFKKIVF